MSGDIFLWRGFRHEWLRTVAGFKTPHRISRLESYIEVPASDPATFHFGQAAGVDGNYMRPVGHHARVRPPEGVVSTTASVRFAWTDETSSGPYPQARSVLSGELEVSLDADPFASIRVERFAVVLAGFRLNSTCDPAKQPPDNPRNSDGMWPFRFAVHLGDAVRDGDTLRCPVHVELHRAWTPNLGGLPPFEVKPLNARLDIELEIEATIIAGPADRFDARPAPLLSTRRAAREASPTRLSAILEADPERPVTVGALRGFGFELVRASDHLKHGHLGRYLGTLHMGLRDGPVDPSGRTHELLHDAQVWIPITVVPCDVEYELAATLLCFGSEARVWRNREAVGQLCFNSTEQAPFFSRWCHCGEPGTGPERSRHACPIED